MQDCFRQHPDVYGAELEDDEEIERAAVPESVAPAQQTTSASETDASSRPDEKHARAKDVHTPMNAEQGEHAGSDLPKSWHDTKDKNESVAKEE